MRLVRVLHNYGGHVTNDRRIEPGLYSEDDPRLFGVGDYLIENGHAELAGVLPDPEPVAEETTLPADDDTGGESGEQSPAEDTGGESGEQSPAEDTGGASSPAGEDAPPEEAPVPKRKKA